MVPVDGERERQDRGGDDELRPVQGRLQGGDARGALRQIAHARGEAGLQKQDENRGGPEERPQLQPVSAFEVGIRAGALLRRKLVEVRARRGRGIDRAGRPARRCRRRRKQDQLCGRGREQRREEKWRHAPTVSARPGQYEKWAAAASPARWSSGAHEKWALTGLRDLPRLIGCPSCTPRPPCNWDTSSRSGASRRSSSC